MRDYAICDAIGPAYGDQGLGLRAQGSPPGFRLFSSMLAVDSESFTIAGTLYTAPVQNCM